MVANKVSNLSLYGQVEKEEDTDILCLLIHHYTENHNEIVMTTRNGSHSISKIVNALDANIKRILLFIIISQAVTRSAVLYMALVK